MAPRVVAGILNN